MSTTTKNKAKQVSESCQIFNCVWLMQTSLPFISEHVKQQRTLMHRFALKIALLIHFYSILVSLFKLNCPFCDSLCALHRRTWKEKYNWKLVSIYKWKWRQTIKSQLSHKYIYEAASLHLQQA